MVNETRTFGLVAVLAVAGLVVLLYGVSLNSGQALNATMVVGGAVLVVAVGALTAAVAAVDADHAEA